MPKIFISYRREDSQYQADRLHAALKQHVANAKRDIFIDVDNIPVGRDFVDHLDRQVAQCDVLLALIGPDWLDARNTETGQRRLDDPKDFVRIEIASALKRGIPVAPILLDGAAFPPEHKLPDDLKPLVRRNGVEVRRVTFDTDAERMIRGLQLKEIGRKPGPVQSPPGKSAPPAAGGPSWFVPVVAVAGLLLVGGGAAFWMFDPLHLHNGVQSAIASPTATVATSPVPSAIETSPTVLAKTTTVSPPVTPSAAPPGLADAKSAAPTQSPASLAWKVANQKDAAALRDFLKRFGSAPEAETARLVLRSLDAESWASASDGNNVAGYQAYLARFPASATPPGARAQDATSRIASLTATASKQAEEERQKREAAAATSRDPVVAAFAAAANGGAISERDFRDRQSDGSEGPQMVALPVGSFTMGSPSGEANRRDNEGPQRQVRIGYQVAVGKYDVTWAEYDRCVSDGGCAAAKDDGFGKGSRPVTNVSWDEAKAYAAWLSRKTGKTYRLLSEAEWEYAARAGTPTPYNWGPEIGRGRAACNGCGSQWDAKSTAPVGSFQPNAFGLYDMAGNVWQWLEDCYENSYSAGQPSDGRAYAKGSCSSRVSRGGSWYISPQYLRSALRNWNVPSNRYNGVGFRLART